MKYYLAIDIGASSGRHILGYMKNGKLMLEEIYRFENGIKIIDGSLCWDIENLSDNVVAGIAECKKTGKIPETVAIDTWGVDYVLLDEDKKELKPTFSYRDDRTVSAKAEVENVIPRHELFKRTGIQPLQFNTVYQLYCDKKSGKLDKAKYFLMIPDYLSFKLTGIVSNEYTNATTGALVNVETNDYDYEVFEKLGIKKEIFAPLSNPATLLGEFSDEVKERVGFNAKVVHAPSHDTASAVLACPTDDKSMYISSGTWSLVGTEVKTPILSNDACDDSFTNEGGVEYNFRFLKNIMGMWIFQNIRKNVDSRYSYDEIMDMARKSTYDRLINPNDQSFIAPENMIQAIKNYLGDDGLTLGDVAKSVYMSLAKSYKDAVDIIEKHSGKAIENIIIVGGGSRDKYLNELTGEYTGKRIVTGIYEATATGNILSQIMYDENIDVKTAREMVNKSFAIC